MSIATPRTRQRGERLEARVSRETKVLFERAAALEGRSLTDFLVTSGVEAAKRTIREKEFLDLTERDRTVFVTALLMSAPEPNARLRKAAEQHRRLLG